MSKFNNGKSFTGTSLTTRGPSIDASYQVSVHLAKRFQRRRFSLNQPIRNKRRLWRPCLLTDHLWKVLYKDCYTPRNEVVGGYAGFTMSVRPSVDKSYIVR
jgi:hypothetical protein